MTSDKKATTTTTTTTTLHPPTPRQTWELCKDLICGLQLAFNTIMPDLLSDKLKQLSVPTSICQWITSFLTDRQAASEAGQTHIQNSHHQHLCPSGLHLSPLLFSLYTNDCTSKDPLCQAPEVCGRHYSHRPSSRMVTCLLADRRLSSWLSGAVLTTWS